ncbi:M48 family metallopeptidase [Primorskyibacter sp. 2E233]|uniref:M48 family metallopeptidase n=1 Tax=Primorskyibacter sp. 2E233 TaxID=3413431 RepID=UPI003BF0E488
MTVQIETRALLLDGETGSQQPITLRIDEDRQALVGGSIDWPLDEVREVPDQAQRDLLLIRRANDPVQRLILPDRSFELRFPKRLKAAPVTRRGPLLKWAAAAVASVVTIVFVLVPIMADQLAVFIPPEGERALGEVTLTQIRDAMDETGFAPIAFCEATKGRAALETLQARLEDVTDLPTGLSVYVLDHDMVNAFALPGGHIVFFRGLIEATGSPEEVAAVFAHEIGHVVSRDPTRHALRSAGSIGVLGLMFGDFAGGALVLFLTERLIDAQYSQGAEASADVYAHAAMLKAGLTPSALADMFERFRALGGDHDGIVAHFLSHPALGDRIAAARAATPSGFIAAPLMDANEWRDLQNICDQKRLN